MSFSNPLVWIHEYDILLHQNFNVLITFKHFMFLRNKCHGCHFRDTVLCKEIVLLSLKLFSFY